MGKSFVSFIGVFSMHVRTMTLILFPNFLLASRLCGSCLRRAVTPSVRLPINFCIATSLLVERRFFSSRIDGLNLVVHW